MLIRLFMAVVLLLGVSGTLPAALRVDTSFPGGSATVTSLDVRGRILRIKPAEPADRGWPCWWFVRVDGTEPGVSFSLEVHGMNFALPDRAAVSADNAAWTQTGPGQTIPGGKVYGVVPAGASVWLAWGPPFQWKDARTLVATLSEKHADVDAFELCRSREGRAVPALRFRPTEATALGEIRTVWIQARQHAWECGSSWVAKGFAEWMASPQAREFRRGTEVVIVPIMDLDNVERGAGGKDQKPHDHNRDWSDRPHWPEVAAAQAHLRRWDAAGLETVFIDLHNPGPNDRVPFFFTAPEATVSPVRRLEQSRFLEAARIGMGKGPLAFTGMLRSTGPDYHPLWERISSVWVSRHMTHPGVSLCLETSWNTPESRVAGYEHVGASLGRTLELYERGKVVGAAP